MSARLVCALLAGWCTSACLDVAAERAERDAEVGRAERDGAELRVRDGLAAVRDFAAGRIELWANAPSLDVELELGTGTAREWTLALRNVLPGAGLRGTFTAPGGAASELVPAAVDGERPSTERRYFFAVPGPGRVELHFEPAEAPSDETFDFLVFADVQNAIDEVGDIFALMNEITSARFAVIVGDITSRGSGPELARFQEEMRVLTIPIYATLGNHELGDGDVPYHDYFGRGSQSFTFHDARFTLLDSASATVDPRVYGWLDAWLAAGRGRTHFVFGHIPPIDPVGIRNGAFSSRAEANMLLSRLARGGVTGTFYGHVHSYYAFENAGMPAFISGGGGAIPERFDGIGRHFLVVHVEPATRRFDTRVVRVD